MHVKRMAVSALALVIGAAGGMLCKAQQGGAGGAAGGAAAGAGGAEEGAAPARNMALFAKAKTSFVSGHESLEAMNDGFEPRNQGDHRHGAYGNWPQTGVQWVEYDWGRSIHTGKVDVYWWADGQGVHLPRSARVLYWDGKAFVPVKGAEGLGVTGGAYNTTTFEAVTTDKLRLEFDGGESSTGILEWKVWDAGGSPQFPPAVVAGIDRVVVMPAKTFLYGSAKGAAKGNGAAETGVVWSKESGPGEVRFEDERAMTTAATFSAPGEYVLKLTAGEGDLTMADRLRVKVTGPVEMARLDPVYTRGYKVNSPLWNARVKALMVNWIPHCIAECENPEMQTSDPRVRNPTGGIDNFIEAGKKLRGEPFKPHVGYVFSNAWVHNTVEAMSMALQVDAQGDPEILAAQESFRKKLDEWIPIILGAQEPDGYLQTRFTLGTAREQGRRIPGHWTVKGDHEGYTGGYFIESAIANYLATGGKDLRLYNAAKKLADCWYDNIGPAPKKAWYDGHEEMEQALVRFGRFVNDMEGGGKGDKYVELAKFLLDCRKGGEEYDQSALPVIAQYEAVGHSVRASYLFSAMADVAMEKRDPAYQSAVLSLWDNVVNRKYYVTGGIGSGETSEGFGKNYSLPNASYCESCSNCGELFFQWKMNMAYHDAKYADLYEETLYNAILGDLDMEGKNFTYTNALDFRGMRYAWHTCPCCVTNIARTMLMLPTWMYAKGSDGVYVNLYIGSTVDVGQVGGEAGTQVQMVQETDYPWSGKVGITVNPAESKAFTVRVRVPDRSVSELYSSVPDANGIVSLAVNGERIASPVIENGYAAITRTWKKGDKVELELPMKVQRVKAIEQVAADRGKVAVRYGPLVYSFESVDQSLDKVIKDDAPLEAQWRPDFLGGVMVVTGKAADGTPVLGVPNYARANRPASNAAGADGAAAGRGRGGRGGVTSAVWMRDE
jgi:DUF1680 family protein